MGRYHRAGAFAGECLNAERVSFEQVELHRLVAPREADEQSIQMIIDHQ